MSKNEFNTRCVWAGHDLSACNCIYNSLEQHSVHDKFHRTLILSGFCFLKIAKISLNSSFFP
ncbi:hypothetical protein ROR61_12545, partial [Acinetobacter baumannii]|nr:hypothetical protein [Acinetobacter baumannii]MDY7388117.1 hypothetical protein [Acinetobacter baumannii]MDY7413960.1 hypothetical protein [Acinetobacter baumannii]